MCNINVLFCLIYFWDEEIISISYRYSKLYSRILKPFHYRNILLCPEKPILNMISFILVHKSIVSFIMLRMKWPGNFFFRSISDLL